jgi:Ca-activated chloride channel family protein
MADLHFLRPLWLLLLLALPVVVVFQQRMRRGDTGWQRYIPPALLRPLIRSPGAIANRPSARMPWWPLAATLIVMSVALAGPSWREAPTPLKQPGDSLVIVLDLSLSMLATDVQPDRLTLAKRKIRDILDARKGALTALLVYSGDAHVVTPLTDDQRTIEAMLDALEPTIMPAQGNRADLAVRQATELLKQGAPGPGRILLITDAVPEQYFAPIRETLAPTPYPLNVLVVGTPNGGPIPLAKRGFIREDGEIVITRAEPDQLAQLASANGGQSSELTLDDQDIRRLALTPEASDEWADSDTGQTVSQWQDDGYWLLWLALPLLWLGWRRGAFAVVMLALMPLSMAPRPALALDWGGLWQREDQRARELINQNPTEAARVLETPGWRGAARYREGDFAAAAEAFADQPGAIGHYNRGNALAKAGKLEQALAAYQQALADNPQMEDARFNHDLVQELLEQQQQGGQDQSSSQNDQNRASEQNQNQQNRGTDRDGQGEQNQDASPGQQQGQQGQDSQPSGSSQSSDPGNTQGNQQAESQNPGSKPGNNPGNNGESAPQGQGTQAPAPVSGQPLTQGQEQWLRRIPDDPGGLLQRKFLQQYQQRQTAPDEGDTPW